MNTAIHSLATANPERYVQGPEAYLYFKHHWNLTPEQDELYRKVLLDGPNEGRYIAVEHDTFADVADQDKLIAEFEKQARTLNRRAAEKALGQTGLTPADIQAVVMNTCTGYLCPGLGAYLVEDMGLNPGTKVFDLMGMGCGAAIPNLECASSLAQQYHGPVLSIAVEVSSATMFNSPDPGCIISNCIFADGAAAMVVSNGSHNNGSLVRILDFATGIFPRHRDSLKFVSDGGKLRNVLSRRVPIIGAKTISEVTTRLLDTHGMTPADIDHWAIHPGGTAVLEQVQKQLGLADEDIRHSLHVFTHYGNMSSPSVLFVLRQILDTAELHPGQHCCALSFGAGFSAHAALLKIN